MTVAANNIGTDIAQSIEAESGLTIDVLYGESGEVILQEINLRNETDYRIYFKVLRSSYLKRLTDSSGGLIQTGTAAVFCFMQKAYDTIQLLHTFFEGAGYVTELGGFGRPANKYTIGNLTVWKFIPMGGAINMNAGHFGTYYGIEQLIDYAVALNTDLA